jgi:hypothetical protein
MLLKMQGNEKNTFAPNIVRANYNLIRNNGVYFNNNLSTGLWVWGGVVVKALRYYSDGPGIDSLWCHWIFQ